MSLAVLVRLRVSGGRLRVVRVPVTGVSRVCVCLCTVCAAGAFVGDGAPKPPTHVWAGWPAHTPGEYALVAYHEPTMNLP